MIFTTFNAAFHYVEEDNVRMVFISSKDDHGLIDILTNHVQAEPITAQRAQELLKEDCTFQFGAGSLVGFGERVQ